MHPPSIQASPRAPSQGGARAELSLAARATRDVLPAGISAINIAIGHVSGGMDAFEPWLDRWQSCRGNGRSYVPQGGGMTADLVLSGRPPRRKRTRPTVSEGAEK